MTKPYRYWSLSGQFLLYSLIVVTLSCALTAALSLLQLGTLHTVAAALLLMLPLSLFLLQLFCRPLQKRLQALSDGAANLSENDFSISIASGRKDEIGEVIDAFNRVSSILREERRNIFQRELLLDTVLQSAPLALVLTDLKQRIIYANPHARHLFLTGHKLEGLDFNRILEDSPSALRDAVTGGRQGLVSLDIEGETEVYHISRQHFALNARDHELWLFKPMTRELNRQEVAIWKKVIRVISHELNNSLGPIASLANSGLRLCENFGTDNNVKHLPKDAITDLERKLPLIFNTIAERSQHLHRFIEGYANFARLPAPRKQRVEWTAFLARLRETQRFTPLGDIPRQPACFDPIQLEQALINLLKNAREAGSPAADIHISIEQNARTVHLQVLDRGTGIHTSALSNAMLPFYSTKKSGTGLGLALCREIMEAHDGRIAITRRAGGGTRVSLWLPIKATNPSDSCDQKEV